jgi:hypothetical protein
MKKHLFFFLSFFSISIFVKAQLDSTKKRQIIHGVVVNEKNKPIQDASVVIQGEEKGIVTDSLGYFKINAKSNAVLIINAAGYESLSEKIRNEGLIRAVMIKSNPLNNSGSADETIKQQSLSSAFQDFSKIETGNLYRGSSLPVFTIKENTVGSRYLFDSWVKGKLIDTANREINTYNYLFNYDKMTGKLIATQDKQTVIEVDYIAIRSYSMTDQYGREMRFEKIDLINKNKFLVNLVNGGNKKYALYKSINTKFVKADFVTNGLIQSGNKYDEYADSYDYYIVYGNGIYKKIELKEKAVKQVLIEDKEKVKNFFVQHSGDKLDELLLSELIIFLNQ